MVPASQQNFTCRITRVVGFTGLTASDCLAVEEPLEIRLRWAEGGVWEEQAVAITMRTPGNDQELALGFLAGEGIIRHPSDLLVSEGCVQTEAGQNDSNVVTITLAATATPDMERLRRNFYTSSSCGVCGKTSLNGLAMAGAQNLESVNSSLDAAIVHNLPTRLKEHQHLFEATGGLHAAACYHPKEDTLVVREDVGRHNAVDKLVGWRLLSGSDFDYPCALVLSGRASFELIQKAVMARIPIVAAVGAPSSLAVKLAIGYGVTLLGFVRGERFNIYSHPQRIVLHKSSQESER